MRPATGVIGRGDDDEASYAHRVSGQEDLLVQLAEADRAIRPARDAFSAIEGGMGTDTLEVHHDGLEEPLAMYPQDLYDLGDDGYLRIESVGKALTRFALTREGLEHAERLKRARETRQPVETSGHPLDWNTRVLPVLEAVNRAYASGAYEGGLGVRYEAIVRELGLEEDGEGRFRMGHVLDELVRTGYLEATLTSDIHHGPEFCKLTERGLSMMAGWPSSPGEVAFERLLTILDERIADAATPEERTKWEAFRDGVLGVGRDVVTGVLTTAANAAAKGMVN